MREFVYEALPGRVVFAAGARHRVRAELERLGAQRVLLIAPGELSKEAELLAAAIGERLAASIDEVVQHVPVAHATRARDLARASEVDALVTLGGGSATGLGKAVRLDYPVPQIAIPTTFAGSEMTPIWGMTEGERKTTGRDPKVQPEVVIYDPELCESLPLEVAIPSGMNALAHCVEATYAPGANPLVTLLALEGIRVLYAALPALAKRPEDVETRAEALLGAYLGACALASAGTALHHKACHVLGGMYGLDHGKMNAVVLPHALAYNRPAIPGPYRRIQEALGHTDPPVAFYELVAEAGAPTSLRSIGMPEGGVEEALPAVLAAAAENVREPDEASLRLMLEDAFEGRRPEQGY